MRLERKLVNLLCTAILKIQGIFSTTVLVFLLKKNIPLGRITDIYSAIWNENGPNATKKTLPDNLKYPK